MRRLLLVLRLLGWLVLRLVWLLLVWRVGPARLLTVWRLRQPRVLFTDARVFTGERAPQYRPLGISREVVSAW